MAYKEPKQSPGYKRNEQSALARQIQADFKKLGMTQKELAAASGMPEARVSRILRGGTVRLTEQDMNQLALGLRKTTAERDNLRYLAWPELYEIDKALQAHEGIVSLNCRLAEKGFPLLGNDYQE